MKRWTILALWPAFGVALGSTVARDAIAEADDKKAEAQKHFALGLELFEAQAYDGALVEFLKSRELYPTRNAIKNAGTCLRELKRYDEALDMYEELLTRFGTELPPNDRKFVDEEIAKLTKFVGYLTIQTDVKGAEVTVDGRARGKTPLEKPIRVAVGTHAVRVTHEGYAPFEASIQVSSGAKETVNAKLSSRRSAPCACGWRAVARRRSSSTERWSGPRRSRARSRRARTRSRSTAGIGRQSRSRSPSRWERPPTS